MDNEKAMVFGSWRVGESIGSGTDGRVSYIYRENGEGETVTGVLKTIFFLENRSETKDFNKIGAVVRAGHSSLEEIVEQVANNIDLIMEKDNGKRFVKYEQYEVKKVRGGYVLYVRMEQMRSLENLLREFSLTESETIQIGLAICRSLVRTRKFSYVYPYLKPENILFNEKGSCKLADFGSFSYLEPSKASIAYKKSECFMAPDFISSGKSNTTCDTYALGMILYMLTNRGRLPFCEQYPQPLTAAGLERSKQMRLRGEPLPKPALASDALFAVIKRACAAKVEERYMHPGQMLEALKAVASGNVPKEERYDEVYSHTDRDARQSPAAPASGSANDYLTSKGMPDQRSVIAPPPESLSFEEIMRSIETGGSARSQTPQRPAQPQPARPQAAAPQPQKQAPAAQQPEKQPPKPKKQETLPFDDDEEDEDEPFFDEEESENKTSLLDKIKIPSFKTKDFNGGKGKKPGRFFVRDLPQSGDDRAAEANTKRAGIILIAIVLVLILLIASCSARIKNNKDNAALTQQSSEQLAAQTTEGQSSASTENASEDGGEASTDSSESTTSGESEENQSSSETDSTSESISQISNN